MVENPEWLKFFKMARPSFVPPTRHQVSNKLLKTVHSEVEESVMKVLSNKTSVTLIADCWTNVR